MTLGEVAAAIGAVCPDAAKGLRVCRVSADSRQTEKDDLFVAIKGERFDGHAFVEQARANGAVACICRRGGWRAGSGRSTIPLLEVDDTIAALGRLATHYRARFSPPATIVIAVTGSNGKTTTKSMIDHVLRHSIKGCCSPRSFNNAIGVPLSILSADSDDRYMIIEIGSNARGEIASLGRIVMPDVAVITSIGDAHTEGLGDLNAIAAEKASLLTYVRAGGLAIVNVDNPAIRTHLHRASRVRMVTIGRSAGADWRVTGVRGTMRLTEFELDGEYHVELPMPGIHHATNAAAAFCVAAEFGLSRSEIAERLRSFKALDGRTRLYDLGDIKLIDDTYNANPASMIAALQTMRHENHRRRVFVMGDMLELGQSGPAQHVRMVRAAYDAGIDVLVTVGPTTARAAASLCRAAVPPKSICCEDAHSAAEVLLAVLAPGDTVWVKGSRAMALDRAVARVRADYGRRRDPQRSKAGPGRCGAGSPAVSLAP
ncbi:MAG: UDP-N-acetylmuramoyl-tripeptide--D-alanyl-D-alanine ligase [Phycisphaerae bacterium]